MDEFGVLTEHYGLKPQGKSAPMAASKRPTSTNNSQTRNFGPSHGINSKSSSNSSWNSNSVSGSFLNDHDILFKSNTGQKPKNLGGFDDYDIFGDLHKSTKQSSHGSKSSFDYDSIFSNSGTPDPKSSSTNGHIGDDIFASMPGVKRSASVKNDDIFGSFTSSAKQNASVDDLLGDFGGFGVNSKSSSRNGSGDLGKNASDFDDLIPGFGGSSPPSYGKNIETTKSTFMSAGDPFVVLESTSNPADTSSDRFTDPLEEISKFNSSGGTKPGGSSHTSQALRPPPKPAQVLKADKVKSSAVSSIDELEDFAMGRVRHNADRRSDFRHAREVREKQSAKASRYKEAEDAAQETQQNGVDDLESFFNGGSRSSSVPKSRATTLDPMFDAKISNKGGPEVAKWTSSGASSGAKKAFSPTNVVDDLSSIFGDSPWPPSFGEFQEVEGESEERRRARLGRHQRTQNRLAQAVADMNQRDIQTQHEQEERRRIAETLNIEIKRWAAGKEGNMRALLSSLHNVLWPECGWEAVSLTDLITSASVKKVYRKATLFVHPDKVQQKGATLQQKYTAEKVFDILKEAWNKFSSEELS